MLRKSKNKRPQPKSPFLVIENFISPKTCEGVVNDLGFYTPDVDAEGSPIKMLRCHDASEEIIYDRVKHIIPSIEQHYGLQHRGTETMSFEYYAEGTTPVPVCENSKHINKKWVRVKDRDITGVVFLSDYQDNVPFDSEYEVYGGKLEFPQHNFGFNPIRGTLILFPSDPHFINAISEILAGDLFLAKFHIAASQPYLYQPENFPGNYTNWF